MARAKKEFSKPLAAKMLEEGKTYRQIGEHFGMSPSNAHTRMKGDKRAKEPQGTGKRKTCTGPCAKQKTISAKNFGNNVKSKDGFMHQCRACMSAKQVKAQADIKKRKAAAQGANGVDTKAAGLDDAQRALSLSAMGMPDTDGETLWLLRGAAMAEGITVIELVQKMLTAYRAQS